MSSANKDGVYEGSIRVGRSPVPGVLAVPGVIKRFMAFILIIAMAFPVRIWVPLGPFVSFSVMDAVLMVGALVLGGRFLCQYNINVGDKWLFALLLVPLGASVLSLIWAQDITACVKWILIYSESVCAYLIVINLCGQLRYRTNMQLITFFVALSVVTSALSLLDVPGFFPQTPPELVQDSPEYLAFMASYHARLSHPFIGLSNNFATVISFFIFVFFAFWQISEKKFYFWMAVFTIFAFFCTLSRGALLALFVVGCLYFFRPNRLIKFAPHIMGVICVIGIMFYAYYSINPETNLYLADRLLMQTVDVRLEKIRVGLEKIANKPLVGYGGGVTADSEDKIKGGVHNTYVEQVLYFGVPLGMIVNVSLWALAARFFVWRWRNPHIRTLSRGVGYAILMQLLIFGTQTSFEGSVLRVLFYASIGMALATMRTLALSREFVPFEDREVPA
jgi:hypothetical protein